MYVSVPSVARKLQSNQPNHRKVIVLVFIYIWGPVSATKGDRSSCCRATLDAETRNAFLVTMPRKIHQY